MTQLASSTLSYDQIFFKIRDFFSANNNKSFRTLEDQNSAYKKLIKEIYDNIGNQVSKYDPYIKGEPLSSRKANIFSKTYAEDLNIVGRQLDFLAAKAVSIFNLFSTELETEKKYLERVASKISVLQMYSGSPSNDLYYFGDSFDNMDKVDVSKIRENLMPLINNGICSLPIIRSRDLRSKITKLTKTSGYLGNSHKVIRSLSSDQSESYRYIFEDTPNIGRISSISDSNPLSFVEFEVINVDKSSLENSNYADWEFKFIDQNTSTADTSDFVLSDWSNFDISKSLQMSYTMEYVPNKANSIDIVPYFGSNNLIKINRILATKKDGTTQELLADSIYIGSSVIPMSQSISKNYFFNHAVIKFSEIELFKIEVFFEQENYEQIDIGHIYWKPNYTSVVDSPFYGLDRFNPESLSRDIYEEIEYDQSMLIPKSENPTQFKLNGSIAKIVPVRLRTKTTTSRFLVISFDKKLEPSDYSARKCYFSGWETDINNPNDGFKFAESISYEDGAVANVKSYTSSEEANADFSAFREFISSLENGIITIGGFDYSISNISLEEVTFTNAGRNLNFNVPVISQRQILPAKRKSVGLRDISVFYETYANKAEIVSKSFVYDKPVESLMLSVNSSIDNSFSDKINLKYYISVSDGKWIPISPIQLDNQGIAEVIIFNKNISDSVKLPGVAYLNYPDVPNKIKNVMVKIEMFKNREINITPIIYSYELIAKVSS